MKRLMRLLLCLALVPPTVMAEGALKVGVLVPMSGPASFLGDLESGGVQIALDRYNANRTPGALPIEVLFEDSQSDPKTAITAFNRLAAAGVQLLYVSLTSANMAIKPLAQRRGIVVIAESSHPKLTDGATFMFRNMYSTSTAAQEILRFMRSGTLRRLAILHTEDEFGVTGADELAALAKGGDSPELVARHSFKTTDHDVRAQALAIGQQLPQVVYLLGIGPVQAIAIQQLRQQQIQARIIGYNLCSQGNVLHAAGPAAEGVFSLEPAVDEASSLWQSFQQEFIARYPAVHFEALAGLGYEFIQIAEAAARAGASSGPEIQTFLASGVKIQGIMSEVQFDGARNIIYKPLRLRQVRKGRCEGVDSSPAA